MYARVSILNGENLHFSCPNFLKECPTVFESQLSGSLNKYQGCFLLHIEVSPNFLLSFFLILFIIINRSFP